jgi:hypothetical protein
MLPWMPGFKPNMPGLSFKPQTGPAPQMNVPQPPPLQPPQMPMGNMGGMAGLMGMMGNAYKNRDLPQWAPTNDAAGLINDGQYADPLLRQSAQWNAPDLGFGGWLKGLFR